MKTLTLILALMTALAASAQHKIPHGMVYGSRPNTTQVIAANQLEDFMGKRPRISTTVKGRILQVTDVRNGWFELDGGKGRIIPAHFNRANISIPKNLAGKTAIIEGVAQKQIIAADKQHFAGDRANGHQPDNIDPKRRVSMEVKGVMVY